MTTRCGAWLPVAEPDLQTKPVLVCAVDAILWNYHEFLVDAGLIVACHGGRRLSYGWLLTLAEIW